MSAELNEGSDPSEELPADPLLYSVDNFDPRPSEELVCTVCRGVFRQPVECPCRHVFCRSCIGQWLQLQTSCPVCRQETVPSSIVPVLPLVSNLVARLTTRCPNSGCEKKMSLEHLQRHAKNCEWRRLQCPDCENHFRADAFTEHRRDRCPRRLVRCSAQCGFDVRAEELPIHDCCTEMKHRIADLQKQKTLLDAELQQSQRRIRDMQNELHALRRWISDMGVSSGSSTVPTPPQLAPSGVVPFEGYWYPIPRTALTNENNPSAPPVQPEGQVDALLTVASATSYSQQCNYGSSTAPLLRPGATEDTTSDSDSTSGGSLSRMSFITELDGRAAPDTTEATSEPQPVSPSLGLSNADSQGTTSTMSVVYRVCHVPQPEESSAGSMSSSRTSPLVRPRVKFHRSPTLASQERTDERTGSHLQETYGAERSSGRTADVIINTGGETNRITIVATVPPASVHENEHISNSIHLDVPRANRVWRSFRHDRRPTVAPVTPEARSRPSTNPIESPRVPERSRRSRNAITGRPCGAAAAGTSCYNSPTSSARSSIDGQSSMSGTEYSQEAYQNPSDVHSCRPTPTGSHFSEHGYQRLVGDFSGSDSIIQEQRALELEEPWLIDGICAGILELSPLTPCGADTVVFSSSCVTDLTRAPTGDSSASEGCTDASEPEDQMDS